MDWMTQRSLRTTLLIVFLLLGLVPLTAIGLFANQSAEATLTSAARQRLGDVSYNAIDKLDRNLFERYGDVQAYAQSDPARSMEPARVGSWIDTMMMTYTPIYKLMLVADKSGKVIAINSVDLAGKPLPATRALLGRDVSGERWFSESVSGSVKDGTSLVEDLHRDSLMAAVYGTNNQADLAMSFSAPIKDASGQIIGVWTNRFNWSVATAILSEVEAKARAAGMGTVQLGLVSRARQALAVPDASQILRDSLAQRESLQRMRQNEGSGNGLGLASGQPAFEAASQSAGYSTYPGLGWAAVATQDVAEAVGSALQLRYVTLGAGLLAALLIAMSAWSIASFIAYRVSAVATAAEQVAERDLPMLAGVIRAIGENDFSKVASIETQRLDVGGNDEVGRMAESFNLMIDRLHELEGATRIMSVSLETILNRRANRRA